MSRAGVGHDAQHWGAVILAFAVREAARYPLYATIAALVLVIWVILKVRCGAGAAASEPPVVVVRTGAGLLAAAGIAGAAWYALTRHPAAAKVAAVPTPVITQKTISRTVVQHVTHVTAAPSHTGVYVLIGLYVLFGIAAMLVLGTVLRVVARVV